MFERDSRLDGDEQSGFAIKLEISTLKHHMDKTFPEFLLLFKSWEDVSPFEAEVIITAGNMPEPKVLKIPFLFDVA